MTERDDIETRPDAATGDPGLDERAALAERVDADPATDAELDERSRRALGQMRALCAVLREAGPAEVSEGFGDRVLARLRQAEAPGQVARLAPRPRARRVSPAILVQAASLAALLFTYGALLAATRVHDVGPRWQESSDSAEPDAAAKLDVVPERLFFAAARPVACEPVVSSPRPGAARPAVAERRAPPPPAREKVV